MIYNVHAGHCPQGQGASGASGLLKESIEDRLVKNEVIRLLKKEGHTVYDCTDDTNCSEYTNLYRIVEKCNAHSVNLDISIHLNSGRNDYYGDNSTGGVEVFNYNSNTKAVSDRICQKISSALNIRNRGTKYSTGLYVLNNTVSPAILIECCFVDDKDDYDRWDYLKCAKAIVEGILNKTIDSNEFGWIKDNTGWWYKNKDGSYPKNKWVELDAWYYFDNHGYAVTGWKYLDNKWYYFGSDCRMKKGWIEVDNKWYFLEDSGALVTNKYIPSKDKEHYYHWVNAEGVWTSSSYDVRAYGIYGE